MSSWHTLRFDELLVVVPVARAGRRLLELMAQLLESEHAGPWTPPQIVTPGPLPEALYEPRRPLVSETGGVMARYSRLRSAGATALEPLLGPTVPGTAATGHESRAVLMSLAEDLAALAATLAADGLSVADAANRCAAMPDVPDERRWRMIAALQADYERALAEEKLSDRHTERLAAMDERRLSIDRRIVLVGTNDLPGIARRMLDTIANQAGAGEATITAVIPAPEEEAPSFDHLGTILLDSWSNRSTPISERSLRVVDRALDQAQEVLWSLAADPASAERAAASPDQVPTLTVRATRPADRITVGLGDEQMGPLLQRTLTMAGIPARLATGRPLTSSGPMTLLAALARFGGDRRLSDFIALIRHPEIQRFAARQGTDVTASPWIGLLDRYATEHLQARCTGEWLGDSGEREQLAQAYDLVASLLDTDTAEADDRPLCDWSEPIAAILSRVYADRALDRRCDSDSRLIDALSAVTDLLADLHTLPRNLCPPVPLPGAMGLIHALAADRTLPSPGGGPSVELLGWLELALDDAPTLVVTGLNEGCVPQAGGADALLPDSLRRRLGLVDDARRYARDMFLLHVMVHSRPDAVFIAGRTDARGEPLKPSRLTLATHGRSLARRVAYFYGLRDTPGVKDSEDRTNVPPVPVRPALTPLPTGRDNQLLPPLPIAPPTPLDRLRVTAFRDYMECPYRFYLRHILHLETADDMARELDAPSFGTLGHDVLAWFGHSPWAATDDAEAARQALSETLDRLVRQRFGPTPLPAVRLQVEQLRTRLGAFVDWQARQMAEGWRIVPEFVEKSAVAVLTVDGKPFTITGRIDRVDRHPTHGYRILDYKMSDTGRSPEKAHRKGPVGQKRWVDLQLPLYRHLAAALGLVSLADSDTTVNLGYIVLPKKVADVREHMATWEADDLKEADEEAHRVIRAIRAGIFWPPGDPDSRRFDDGLEALCFDDYPRRTAVIARVSAALAAASRGGNGGGA